MPSKDVAARHLSMPLLVEGLADSIARITIAMERWTNITFLLAHVRATGYSGYRSWMFAVCLAGEFI